MWGDVEFLIPLQRQDLLVAENSQFCVSNEYSAAEIKEKLKGVYDVVKSDGYRAVLDFENAVFDVLFSCSGIVQELDRDVRRTVWHSLISCCQKLANDDAFCDIESLRELSPEGRMQQRNYVQMVVYLTVQWCEACEDEVLKAMRQQAAVASTTEKRGRGRTAQNVLEVTQEEWIRQKRQFLESVARLLQGGTLKWLWDPPIVDEQFVSLISNCCFKFLENQDAIKNSAFREAIWNVLEELIRNYNHSLACSIKIIQLLQQYEFLGPPLAEALARFENKCRTVVSDVLRELGRVDSEELAREGGTAKNYATFLLELSQLRPDAVLPYISAVVSHLDGESYTMRNCVLGVLTELILQRLSEENMELPKRQTRDQFLDRLEEHVHDTNAFVRARCIQLWTRLLAENMTNSVPIPKLIEVLKIITGRLKDKASSVRKAAIQFLTTCIQKNPLTQMLLACARGPTVNKEVAQRINTGGAFPLKLAEVRQLLDQAKQRLERIVPSQHAVDFHDVREAEERWTAMVERLQAVVSAWLDSERDDSAYEAILETVSNENGVIRAIGALLLDAKFDGACAVLDAARSRWPEHRLWDISCAESTKEAPVEGYMHAFKAIFEEFFVSRAGVANTSTAPVSSSQTETAIPQTKKVIDFLTSFICFLETFQSSMEVVCQLLYSKSQTDVLESICFVVACREAGIEGADKGVRQMFHLVWSKEQSVLDALVHAFQQLYLQDPGNVSRERYAIGVVDGLINLVVAANHSELTSLEKLICELVEKERLDKVVVEHLWQVFMLATKAGGRRTEDDVRKSRAALQLLGMVAEASKAVIENRLADLVTCGLGKCAEKDFQFARDACYALDKVASRAKVKGAARKEPVLRLPIDHIAFTRIADLIANGVIRTEDAYWIPMMEYGLNVVFSLAEHPDKIAQNLIQRSSAKIKAFMSSASNHAALYHALSRHFHLLGHVALRLFVHLDVTVVGELKRRVEVKEVEAKKGKASPRRKHGQGHSRRSSPTKSPGDTAASDAAEEEMGLAGAVTDDLELEFVNKVCEQELFGENTVLGQAAPMIVHICQNPHQFRDAQLQAAAALALSKFMLVSSSFCDSNLRLLFTLLEKSEYAEVRANTIIALGDLCFRFPNLVEPWTQFLYGPLHDDCLSVRLNCILVLTHLILNDQIKVKGYVSDLARCVLDEEQRVAGLARQFFNELAQKGNMVYNLMPDIISRLLDAEAQLTAEDFKAIMKFLFSFIQKEKQCETLIEKLCQRFQATRTLEQWRLLSFCLTLLTYNNEKAVRKLQENTGCFGEKLYDREVFENFTATLANARKNLKQEAKVLIDEIEQQWTALHEKGAEDDLATQRALSAVGRTPRQRKTHHVRHSVQRHMRTPIPTSLTEDSDSDYSDSSRSRAPSASSARPRRRDKFVNPANQVFAKVKEEPEFRVPRPPVQSAADMLSPTGPLWAAEPQEVDSDVDISASEDDGGEPAYRKRKQRNKRQKAAADSDDSESSSRRPKRLASQRSSRQENGSRESSTSEFTVPSSRPRRATKIRSSPLPDSGAVKTEPHRSRVFMRDSSSDSEKPPQRRTRAPSASKPITQRPAFRDCTVVLDRLSIDDVHHSISRKSVEDD